MKPTLILIYCLATPGFSQGQVLESSRLPIVIVDSVGPILDEPKTEGSMRIIHKGSGQLNYPKDPPTDYAGPIAIEIRGGSSQLLFPKLGYGFELRTPTGEDLSAVVLGMPKEEDWVLHGPYSDKTLIRNALAFELWSHTGRYGSRTQFVELIVNGGYEGVYVLLEKVKRDNVRVDIARLLPDANAGDDLTGGYILKIDKFTGSNSRGSFISSYPPPGRQDESQVIYFQYEYPKGNLITLPQKQYISSYLRKFEKALASDSFQSPVTGYRQFADVSSFIDFAILNELSKNVDAYRLSTFIYKEKDSKGGKLTMGPPWDFNLAFGNSRACRGGTTDGWAWDFNTHCPGAFWLVPFWWQRFIQDEAFVRELKGRWSELRRGPYQTAAVIAYIDSLAQVLEEPRKRNFQRWPEVLNHYVWPNNFVGQTYAAEIDYLKSWITDRFAWLDENIGNLQVNDQ